MLIAVCDDNEKDRESIIDCLYSYFFDKSIKYKINQYENHYGLIFSVKQGNIYDVIFLNTHIKNKSGINIAKTLRNINFKGKIIFVTDTEKYAVESYEVSAYGYILKSHMCDKILGVMNKVVNGYNIKHFYQLRYNNNYMKIHYNDITYIESNNSKCILHSNNGTTYTIYKRLDEIEKEINDKRFLRCHQSYLVNMNYIQKADKNFELSNGEIVNIRQRNLKAIKELYWNYITKKK